MSHRILIVGRFQALKLADGGFSLLQYLVSFLHRRSDHLISLLLFLQVHVDRVKLAELLVVDLLPVFVS